MFRWIRRKKNALKSRFGVDFENTAVYDFSNFMENVGKVLAGGIGLLNVVVMIIGTVFVNCNILPMTSVWITYTSIFIFTPAIFMGLGFIALHAFYLKRLPPDERWWTCRKIDKVHHFMNRVFFWSLIAFVLCIALFATQPLYSYVFIPQIVYNIIAIKLLVLGNFYTPICFLLCITSFLRLFFLKFGFYMERQEALERSDRDSRETGSLSDNASEDEIWNMKLKRMGL